MIFRNLLLAVTMLAPVFSHSAEGPMSLRVMSFNLRYINSEDQGEKTWIARRDQVGQIIREDKSDIVGLQEAFRQMLDDVKARVPGYEEIGVGREDGKEKGEYAAILVRKDRFNVLESGTFWLSDTPEIPNSCTWKNRVTRICTWAKLQEREGSKILYFYNTHLDHESQEAREKSVGLILEKISAREPGTPFVITGDFNAGEDNSAIAKIKAAKGGILDTWREGHVNVPVSESGTMSLFTGALDTDKIDYIFVPAGTRLVDSEIIRKNQNGNYPSDHYPLRASIEFQR